MCTSNGNEPSLFCGPVPSLDGNQIRLYVFIIYQCGCSCSQNRNSNRDDVAALDRMLSCLVIDLLVMISNDIGRDLEEILQTLETTSELIDAIQTRKLEIVTRSINEGSLLKNVVYMVQGLCAMGGCCLFDELGALCKILGPGEMSLKSVLPGLVKDISDVKGTLPDTFVALLKTIKMNVIGTLEPLNFFSVTDIIGPVTGITG
ncbi:uncharacterized protein [Eleutherodactylus coqui]|uniref:uncharacterized protein isoform X3 n=1 Tax=Eleutherodactylus coqui TaxID=57060 RepID=UPI0034618095